MTDFEEAMMVRAAAQGNERASQWLADLDARTDGRDGLSASTPVAPSEELVDSAMQVYWDEYHRILPRSTRDFDEHEDAIRSAIHAVIAFAFNQEDGQHPMRGRSTSVAPEKTDKERGE